MQPNKDFDLLYLAALRFLAHKPRTESEVLLKLQKFIKVKNAKNPEFSVSADLIREVIDTLKEEKFINDSQYVDLYISSQVNSSKKSILFIKKFLIGKGIPRDIVEGSLSQFKENDTVTAKNLAAKKIESLRNNELPARKLREKVITYLLGKGLTFDTASDAVDSLLGVK